MKYTYAGFRIDIDLTPGAYNLPLDSAEGKTYLCRQLNNCNIKGDKVLGYSFNEHRRGQSLNSILGGMKPEVLMLDRYDLYNGEYVDIIKEVSKYGVVLIDCKGVPKLGNFICEACYLDRGPDYIEVGR